METKYYWKMKNRFLAEYAFIDTREGTGLRLLRENGLFVREKALFKNEGCPKYSVVVCQLRKKDSSRFIEAMKELPNKLALLGYIDYEAVAAKIGNMISAA